jgi:hypothetical protein
MISKLAPPALKDANDTTGEVVAVMNSGATDRTGETLDRNGWRLDTFKASGVITLNHAREGWNDTMYGLPIAKALDAWVDQSAGLLVRYRYLLDAPSRLGELAQVCYHLEKSGALAGHSVWFEPFGWTNPDGSVGVRQWGDPYPPMPVKGRTYTAQDLIECGPVLIPAEPKSVTVAVKAFEDRGLDVPGWARKPLFASDEEMRVAFGLSPAPASDTEVSATLQRAGRVLSGANIAIVKSALEAIDATQTSLNKVDAALVALMEAAGESADDDDNRELAEREFMQKVLDGLDGSALARAAMGG